MNSDLTILLKRRKCVCFVRVDDEGKCGGKSEKYKQDWRKRVVEKERSKEKQTVNQKKRQKLHCQNGFKKKIFQYFHYMSGNLASLGKGCS